MNETYLYPYSAQEARTRNQLPMWRESYHANVACRNAIEETIRQSFDGMHLKKDCLEPVLAEYGYKRTEWVLATTLQELSWDGRFSRTNKQWAARRYIPQDERHNAEITVRSHPAILDGFVDLYRKAYQELGLFGPGQRGALQRIYHLSGNWEPEKIADPDHDDSRSRIRHKQRQVQSLHCHQKLRRNRFYQIHVEFSIPNHRRQ